MSDGISITPGYGKLIATDEIAGAHYQIVKIATGADGVVNLITLGLSQSSNSVPVVIASDQAPVSVMDAEIEPNGTEEHQRITVSDSVVVFGAFSEGTHRILYSIESADVRVTFDGTTPSNINGHLLREGDNGMWSLAMAVAAKFIKADSTSAIIYASQMRKA